MARILVVDDENNIRMMIQLALEQAGHQVDAVADGQSGLKKFGDGKGYDLVLLDQRMPEMEGLEVLQKMRARNPSSRIVMITAFGTIDLAVDAMKAGATDFLRKPFTTETLRGAVLGALAATPKSIEQVQPAAPRAEGVEPTPLLYGLTTVNGYHIESDPEAVVVEHGDRRYTFAVRHPNGSTKSCVVLLPAGVMSDAKLIARRTYLIDTNRFWHALCEHVLSDYLYRYASYPPDFLIRVDEVDRGLRNWIKAATEPA